MRKLLSLITAMTMLVLMGNVCFAAEENQEYGDTCGVIIDQSKESYEVVDAKPVTDGHTKASWGQGIIHGSNPVFSHPSAYAETQTFAGTAHCMRVQLGLIDNDGNSYLTDEVEANDVSSVSSATLLSPTEKCEFMGYHGIQDIDGSEWQTCSTYKKY